MGRLGWPGVHRWSMSVCTGMGREVKKGLDCTSMFGGDSSQVTVKMDPYDCFGLQGVRPFGRKPVPPEEFCLERKINRMTGLSFQKVAHLQHHAACSMQGISRVTSSVSAGVGVAFSDRSGEVGLSCSFQWGHLVFP